MRLLLQIDNCTIILSLCSLSPSTFHTIPRPPPMPIPLSRAKLTNLSSSPSLPVRGGRNEEEVVQKPSRPKPNEKRSPCPALKTYFSFSLQSPLSPLPPGEPYFFLFSLSPFFLQGLLLRPPPFQDRQILPSSLSGVSPAAPDGDGRGMGIRQSAKGKNTNCCFLVLEAYSVILRKLFVEFHTRWRDFFPSSSVPSLFVCVCFVCCPAHKEGSGEGGLKIVKGKRKRRKGNATIACKHEIHSWYSEEREKKEA